MSTKFVNELRQKIIKSFIDIFILSGLKESQISGYDVISQVHKKFGILVSPGTVYSTLYSLERQGLIKAVPNERKRIYRLTENGTQTIQALQKSTGDIHNLLRNVLSLH